MKERPQDRPVSALGASTPLAGGIPAPKVHRAILAPLRRSNLEDEETTDGDSDSGTDETISEGDHRDNRGQPIRRLHPAL